MDVKPIETVYKGYRFRSRLEARWAVFFDALGVEWEYEPEGFDINGTYYLPDFLIHDVEGIHACEWRHGIYVEVKGVPDEASAEKVWHFIEANYSVWIVGAIPDPDDYIADMERQRNHYCKTHRNMKHHCALCINDFGTLDGDLCFPFTIDYTDHLIFRGSDSSYGYGTWSQKVSDAFRAARQARFEHGESPEISGN